MTPSAYGRPRRARRRTGAALPLALLIIVILTTLTAGTFSLIGTERRVNDDQESELDAYLIARTGMERFLTSRGALGFTSIPAAAVESTTIILPGGYADVVLRLIRPGVDSTVPALYVVRSRGVKTRSGGPRVPVAERTVAQYARWQTGSINVISAWTAMAGLQKNGGSGTLSGEDGCGKKDDVAGVAVPTVPGYTQSGGQGGGGGGLVPKGDPDILRMGTQAQTSAAVNIDWEAIVAGHGMQPDIEIPGDAWPTSSQWSDPTFWPVIRANGNFTVPSDGRGTLVVTGNLTINGSTRWQGIVLAGGVLTANGNNTVTGAVISGLNIKLGMSVPESDVGNGTKTYQYNSCDVDSAINGFTGLVPYRNAGADNWRSF